MCDFVLSRESINIKIIISHLCLFLVIYCIIHNTIILFEYFGVVPTRDVVRLGLGVLVEPLDTFTGIPEVRD